MFDPQVLPMDVVNAGGIQSGGRPGVLNIPGIGMVDAKTWTEEVLYDTEIIATPAPAGTIYNFFRSNIFTATGLPKNRLYNNMEVASQLPNMWNGYVYQIGVRVLNRENAVGGGIWTTANDIKRTLEGGYGEFVTGATKTERAGPLLTWACPIGLTGVHMRTNAGDTVFTALNNGVASLGATPPMDISINLSDEMTFNMPVTFFDGLILDVAVYLQVMLFLYIAKPVR